MIHDSYITTPDNIRIKNSVEEAEATEEGVIFSNLVVPVLLNFKGTLFKGTIVVFPVENNVQMHLQSAGVLFSANEW